MAAALGVGCALKTEDENASVFVSGLEETKGQPHELLHEHLLTTLHRCRWAKTFPLPKEAEIDIDGHIGELQLGDSMFQQAWPNFNEQQREYFTVLVTGAIDDARKTLKNIWEPQTHS